MKILFDRKGPYVGDYYEVGFLYDRDWVYIDTYLGKPIHKFETAQKCMEKLKKKYPDGRKWEICYIDTIFNVSRIC